MITLKNGDLIGRIQLHIESHRVELGYVMNKSFQGRGYMTETVRSIIDWAFQQPNIYSIFPIIWGGLKIKKRVNFETC
jgi:RimJ/RimL family protein N-acetyltransferase